MMVGLFVAFLALSLAAVQGYQLPRLPQPLQASLNKIKISDIQVNKALIASVMLAPSMTMADDGKSAFVWPLAISIFTMVPFVLYQQALKPKPRTVKQIELDESLRPKDKGNLSKGKEAEARAAKRK